MRQIFIFRESLILPEKCFYVLRKFYFNQRNILILRDIFIYSEQFFIIFKEY